VAGAQETESFLIDFHLLGGSGDGNEAEISLESDDGLIALVLRFSPFPLRRAGRFQKAARAPLGKMLS
jgi:hypothetical protein